MPIRVKEQLDQVVTLQCLPPKKLAVSGSDQSESKILKFELILPMYILWQKKWQQMLEYL